MDKDAFQLALLHSLADLLENCADVTQALESALEFLAKKLGMMRGAITLVAPATGQIRIEAAYGLSRAQREKGEYLRGEGITGQVITSGQPMCIVDISEEPLFLNRTGCRDIKRDHISFLCVPLKINNQTVGALSVDRLAASPEDLDSEIRLLRLIAALLAPAASREQTMMNARDSTSAPPGFVGSSAAMMQVYEQIALVAPSQANVLLHGESGCGKELAARAIHKASPRGGHAFVALNCAALPENLLENELFGHERGAFTGASQTSRGRFELANGGTLFLDEVGELSAIVQAKLLRVLQEKTFERLGGMETLRCDARLIAATNRDLGQMVEAGQFRRDLFYRLNVFPIHLPPLRERREDIIPLAAHFLDRFARAAGKSRPRLSLAAMEALERHPWPGNIRELQNAMERAALLLGNSDTVLPQHLPQTLRDIWDGVPKAALTPPQNLGAALAEMERDGIKNALSQTRGRIGKAASLLGLTPRVLGLRMAKYGLDYREFRTKKVF